MTAMAIIELSAIFAPCAIGIIAVGRSILAANGRLETIDLNALADTLSVCSLIAVVGFSAIRIIIKAIRADQTPSKAKMVQISAYDRHLTKVLAVLVGFGALVICEPIGDQAERWVLGLAQASALSSTMKSSIGYAAFAVQVIVTSVALAVVVKIWDVTGSRLLRLANTPKI